MADGQEREDNMYRPCSAKVRLPSSSSLALYRFCDLGRPAIVVAVIQQSFKCLL
jgi:hypothetical protein